MKISHPFKISNIKPLVLYLSPIFILVLSIIIIVSYPIRKSPWRKIKPYLQTKKLSSKKVNITFYNAKYPFACGPASMEILLKHMGITMSQEEIAALNGRKSIGTSQWEIRNLFNKIFDLHKVPYHAEVKYFTSFESIHQQLETDTPVFILFATQFFKEGFGDHAYYLHFGLVTHIYDNEVTIQSPFYDRKHGENEHGELILSRQDFLKGFYALPKVLYKLEYQPIYISNFWKCIGHKYLNFVFTFSTIAAYHLRILKPGISIQIRKI